MPPGQARATPAHTPAHTPATQPSQPPAPRGRPEAPRQAQGGLPPPAPQGLDRPGALLCCPPAGDHPCLGVPVFLEAAQTSGDAGPGAAGSPLASGERPPSPPRPAALLGELSLFWAGVSPPPPWGPRAWLGGCHLAQGKEAREYLCPLAACLLHPVCPPVAPGPPRPFCGPWMGWSLPGPLASVTGLRGTSLHCPPTLQRKSAALRDPGGRVWAS